MNILKINTADNNCEAGIVIWITGLSGAGKTTLGKEVYKRIRKLKANVIFLDGDMIRTILDDKTGYVRDDRISLGLKYGRFCEFLTNQGIDVVCATISLFKECHKWNKDNIARYYEIYLKVSMETLIERDVRGIYAKTLKGEMKNVVGVDINFDVPQSPYMIINNDGVQQPAEIAEDIISLIRTKNETR